jgi:HTH-type transcriptional regulator / antitoxin HigA
MKTKIIKTEAEFEAAVSRVGELMDAAPGSPEEEELELLGLLVDEYQKEHYPIAPPDPIDAIKFRMDQQGLTRKDLIPYIGSQSKVSEVLNRKRPLSLSMIRALEKGLGIPAEVLIQEPGSRADPKSAAEAEPEAAVRPRPAASGGEIDQDKLQAILTLLEEIAPVVRNLDAISRKQENEPQR